MSERLSLTPLSLCHPLPLLLLTPSHHCLLHPAAQQGQDATAGSAHACTAQGLHTVAVFTEVRTKGQGRLAGRPAGRLAGRLVGKLTMWPAGWLHGTQPPACPSTAAAHTTFARTRGVAGVGSSMLLVAADKDTGQCEQAMGQREDGQSHRSKLNAHGTVKVKEAYRYR